MLKFCYNISTDETKSAVAADIFSVVMVEKTNSSVESRLPLHMECFEIGAVNAVKNIQSLFLAC
jgi:hypothetical protein